MNRSTRRRFAACALAVFGSALTLPARVADAEPIIEFDGRPHQNPVAQKGAKVAATGVVRLPAGCKITKVTVRRQADGANPKDGHTIYEAICDLSKDPPMWSVTMEKLPAGEHWVDAFVEFLTPDRETKVAYSLDKRRVLVKTE